MGIIKPSYLCASGKKVKFGGHFLYAEITCDNTCCAIIDKHHTLFGGRIDAIPPVTTQWAIAVHHQSLHVFLVFGEVVGVNLRIVYGRKV